MFIPVVDKWERKISGSNTSSKIFKCMSGLGTKISNLGNLPTYFPPIEGENLWI